jgi:hypothetical protein
MFCRLNQSMLKAHGFSVSHHAAHQEKDGVRRGGMKSYNITTHSTQARDSYSLMVVFGNNVGCARAGWVNSGVRRLGWIAPKLGLFNQAGGRSRLQLLLIHLNLALMLCDVIHLRLGRVAGDCASPLLEVARHGISAGASNGQIQRKGEWLRSAGAASL